MIQPVQSPALLTPAIRSQRVLAPITVSGKTVGASTFRDCVPARQFPSASSGISPSASVGIGCCVYKRLASEGRRSFASCFAVATVGWQHIDPPANFYGSHDRQSFRPHSIHSTCLSSFQGFTIHALRPISMDLGSSCREAELCCAVQC